MMVKRILTIVTAITVIIAMALTLVSCTKYPELLNANTTADADVISSRLQDIGVQVRVDGARILVPKTEVSELRAVLASEGLTGVSNIDLTILSSPVTVKRVKVHEIRQCNEIIIMCQQAQMNGVSVNEKDSHTYCVTISTGDERVRYRY